MPERDDCERKDLHTSPGPDGYVERSEWAERRLKTHKQRKCPGCGLYRIWVPKKEKVSIQMLKVLRYIEAGQSCQTGVMTLSEAGGRACTLIALERRGWIEDPNDYLRPYRVTAAGRKVLKEHEDDERLRRYPVSDGRLSRLWGESG
jgi:hypothetical protein